MGKPTPMNAGYPFLSKVGSEKTTRGSEPSQYPEEKKAIAIPSVAASERGTAQTVDMSSPWALYRRCCRTGQGVVTETPGSYKPSS